MRVFVAGATGVMGRALLPQLSAAGHEAIGLARSPEKLPLVEKLGARTARGDVLDAETLRRLIRETQPEAVVNLATAIPRTLRMSPKDWEANDRVRVEGTANLLAAAREAGVRLFVQNSFGYVYQPRGDQWIEEDAPLTSQDFRRSEVQAEEVARSGSIPATILRFGMLMAADAWHTEQTIAMLRRGLPSLVGAGDNYLSLIYAEDSARAILCALANSQAAAGQTFNVVDDEPVRMRDMLAYAARVLHTPPPRHIPPFLVKLSYGALALEVLTASYRISNARIKRTLGFAPRYPTYRETWAQIAQEVGSRDLTPSEELK
ncbi:MAG TPA: NAD(P)-dependent oxidoreductase [Chthonomonadaceae bacterium]|nr:NAD(P)-dependent oxidoreductase [Chthonomonadaceae bacterium]